MRKVALSRFGIKLGPWATVLDDGLPLPTVNKLATVWRVGHQAGVVGRTETCGSPTASLLPAFSMLGATAAVTVNEKVYVVLRR